MVFRLLIPNARAMRETLRIPMKLASIK